MKMKSFRGVTRRARFLGMTGGLLVAHVTCST